MGICASLILAGMFAAAPARGQAPDLSKVEFRSEKLGENLHVLFGAGGNIALLTGPDGALVVDSELIELSPKLRAAVAMLSDRPVRFVVNTHFHFDHAGGNAALGRGGAVIVAHDNVRRHLVERQVVDVGVKIETEPTAREGLPVVSFSRDVTLHANEETIAVIHVPHAHTDSDAFILLKKANVLHTGDLFMSIGYPFVDAGNGGSLEGLIAAHAKALALCDAQTRIIPGHGPVVGKSEFQAYHDMLVDIRQRVAAMVKKGWPLERVLAEAPSKEYDERWGKGFIKPELFLQRVFIELSRASRKG